jgi:hypothetical protein
MREKHTRTDVASGKRNVVKQQQQFVKNVLSCTHGMQVARWRIRRGVL